MLPIVVPDSPSLFRRWGLGGVAVGPLLPDELVVLLAPHHTRECLTLDVTEVVGHRQGADTVIEVISLLSSSLHDIVKHFFVEIRFLLLRKPETDNYSLMSDVPVQQFSGQVTYQHIPRDRHRPTR